MTHPKRWHNNTAPSAAECSSRNPSCHAAWHKQRTADVFCVRRQHSRSNVAVAKEMNTTDLETLLTGGMQRAVMSGTDDSGPSAVWYNVLYLPMAMFAPELRFGLTCASEWRNKALRPPLCCAACCDKRGQPCLRWACPHRISINRIGPPYNLGSAEYAHCAFWGGVGGDEGRKANVASYRRRRPQPRICVNF
jgi:hypothetical protein